MTIVERKTKTGDSVWHVYNEEGERVVCAGTYEVAVEYAKQYEIDHI